MFSAVDFLSTGVLWNVSLFSSYDDFVCRFFFLISRCFPPAGRQQSFPGYMSSLKHLRLPSVVFAAPHLWFFPPLNFPSKFPGILKVLDGFGFIYTFLFSSQVTPPSKCCAPFSFAARSGRNHYTPFLCGNFLRFFSSDPYRFKNLHCSTPLF